MPGGRGPGGPHGVPGGPHRGGPGHRPPPPPPPPHRGPHHRPPMPHGGCLVAAIGIASAALAAIKLF